MLGVPQSSLGEGLPHWWYSAGARRSGALAASDGAESQVIGGAGEGRQAGYAVVDGVSRAGIWSGTADSWVDLSAFLPAGFTSSSASGISSDGVNIYVTGTGYNSFARRDEALLWTQPVPTPGAAAVLALGGILAAGRRRR